MARERESQHNPLVWCLCAVLLVGVLGVALATRDSNASAPEAQPRSTSTPQIDTTTPDTTTPDTTTPDTTTPDPTSVDPSSTDMTNDAAAADPASTAASSTAPSSPATTLAPTVPNPPAPADPSFPATAAAFDTLAGPNSGASVSVSRGGDLVVTSASGPTVDGSSATSDTPMVVASVSKFLVALGISRLDEQGLVDVDSTVPWSGLDLNEDEGWSDVTIREVLDHRSGMPKAQESWWNGNGSCHDHLPNLVDAPPTGDRGSWVYSNGNYCLLGLVIEDATGAPLDVALQQLLFEPVGASGIHQTGSGLLPTDAPHWEGTDRLSMLGGAGSLVVSTDDIATIVGRMTAHDREVLQPPGVFTDQYGFGHTGTITGAKACVWVLEGGATTVAATISGNSVATGGDVCDIVVPAVASDLGLGSAAPDRTP